VLLALARRDVRRGMRREPARPRRPIGSPSGPGNRGGVVCNRDHDGVIRFMLDLLAGFGISTVAGVIYVIGRGITLAAMDSSFVDSYTGAASQAERAKGASPAEIDAVDAKMNGFRRQYANPHIRLPSRFIEVLPVGEDAIALRHRPSQGINCLWNRQAGQYWTPVGFDTGSGYNGMLDLRIFAALPVATRGSTSSNSRSWQTSPEKLRSLPSSNGAMHIRGAASPGRSAPHACSDS
jgi:hypothetical protein